MRIFNPFSIATNRDLENTVLISSRARCGSTILSDLINHRKDYRTIFEPFHPKHGITDGILQYPTYLNRNKKVDNVRKRYFKIFRGQHYSRWAIRENQPILSQKRLIKSIRVNPQLEWILKNFPQIKIVVLIRNPFAQVSSYINSGFGTGEGYLNNIIAQKEILVREHYDFPWKLIENSNSIKDNLIHQWGIDFTFAYTALRKNKIHLVKYEDLVEGNQEEIVKLFSFIDSEKPKSYKKLLDKPSSTSNLGGEYSRKKDYLNKWKNRWAEDELVRAQQLLKNYGVSSLYRIN